MAAQLAVPGISYVVLCDIALCAVTNNLLRVIWLHQLQ